MKYKYEIEIYIFMKQKYRKYKKYIDILAKNLWRILRAKINIINNQYKQVI